MELSTEKRSIIYKLGLKEKPYIYEQTDKIAETQTFLLYKVFKGSYCTYAIWDKQKEENIYYNSTLNEAKKELKKITK